MQKRECVLELAKEYLWEWESICYSKHQPKYNYVHRIDNKSDKFIAFVITTDLAKYSKYIWVEAFILRDKIFNCFK